MLDSLSALVRELSLGEGAGPKVTGQTLRIDTVLASRLLKSISSGDPLVCLHRLPGPDPLRRVISNARLCGVDSQTADQAALSVDSFASLIQSQTGGRGAIDAVLSSWCAEARSDFLKRRQQTLFRCMSELKGISCEQYIETAILLPSASPGRVDIGWLKLVTGLRLIRPDAQIRFASRRLVEGEESKLRTIRDLNGADTADRGNFLIRELSNFNSELTRIDNIAGDIDIIINSDSFESDSRIQIALAEMDTGDIPLLGKPTDHRNNFVASGIDIPCKKSAFSVWIHTELKTRVLSPIRVYDTAIRGYANANDHTRFADILDINVDVKEVGTAVNYTNSDSASPEARLLRYAIGKISADFADLHGWIANSDYPLYGSQITALLGPS